jgi:glucan biosynthesis protein C
MAGSKARIYHLDALRCFCMLFGLLVHGATIGSNPFFRGIDVTSEHFRMATFFLISGFFTAMVCSRSELWPFLAARGRLVLIPFVAGVLLLNPVTNWLIQLYHGGGQGFVDYFAGGWRLPLPGPTVWHLHLWFLISLFVYTLVTPGLMKLSGSALAERLVAMLGRWPEWARLFAMALSVGVAVALFRGIADQLLKPMLPEQFGFLAHATASYFPYFAAGLFAWRHRILFDSMHRLFWAGLILFGGVYLVQPLIADQLPRALERSTYWIARGGFIFLIVCALLAVAQRLVTKGSPMLSRLTDGVYSFYIFHFLVIYVIANLVRPFTDNLYLTYAVILAVGYPLLFLIHERLIARSALLTLLFNGKLVARRVQPA